jgi:L-iditol 2-dehydrogenase
MLLVFSFSDSFAEYILLNEMTVKYGPIHHIPENVNSRLATFAELLACCLNGLELTELSVGDTVVVFGLGPMICLLIELARYMGAGKIIAI